MIHLRCLGFRSYQRLLGQLGWLTYEHIQEQWCRENGYMEWPG